MHLFYNGKVIFWDGAVLILLWAWLPLSITPQSRLWAVSYVLKRRAGIQQMWELLCVRLISEELLSFRKGQHSWILAPPVSKHFRESELVDVTLPQEEASWDPVTKLLSWAQKSQGDSRAWELLTVLCSSLQTPLHCRYTCNAERPSFLIWRLTNFW